MIFPPMRMLMLYARLLSIRDTCPGKVSDEPTMSNSSGRAGWQELIEDKTERDGWRRVPGHGQV